MNKLALTIALLLMPTMAVAQQNVNVAPDKVFELKIRAVDLNKISNALGKLPYEEVADLVMSLRQQIFEQANKPVEEKKDVPAASKP